MKKDIPFLALCILITISIQLATTARVYGSPIAGGTDWKDDPLHTTHYSQNSGIVWDWGGYEWRGQPGPFLCAAPFSRLNLDALLAPWLPLVDC